MHVYVATVIRLDRSKCRESVQCQPTQVARSNQQLRDTREHRLHPKAANIPQQSRNPEATNKIRITFSSNQWAWLWSCCRVNIVGSWRTSPLSIMRKLRLILHFPKPANMSLTRRALSKQEPFFPAVLAQTVPQYSCVTEHIKSRILSLTCMCSLSLSLSLFLSLSLSLHPSLSAHPLFNKTRNGWRTHRTCFHFKHT